MKALSLTQPWATLVAIGAKQMETRSWRTHHRGCVAIHAAKGFPADCVRLCATAPFEAALLAHRDAWPKGLPTGAIVAVASIVEVVPTYEFHNGGRELTDDERPFGDYSSGRYAWLLSGVRRLPTPIPCKGALGLWTVPVHIEGHITEALKEIA